MTAALLEAHGVRTGHVPVAAPDLVRRADPDRRRRPRRRRLRRGRPARRGGGRQGRPHARGGRPRHAVRAAGRHRVRGVRAPGRRGRRRRGRPRRPPRRHQRARRAGRGAHQRRPRAHALARPDGARHRAREARRRAARRRTLVTGPLDARGARAGRPDGRRPSCRPRRSRPARAGYQRGNFAVAVAAARALHGELDPARVAEVAARVTGPGADAGGGRGAADHLRRRPQPVGHAGARRRARRGRVRRRGVDPRRQGRRGHAAGAAREDGGRRVHALPHPRALSPATLASLAEQLGGPPSEIVPDPHAAVARAQELAGPDGAVLATGSIYLVADLLGEPGRRRASAL